MACTLEQKQANLCTSGIGKITDPIKLLQVTAQVWCDASISPPDPYDGNLVYTRQGLGTTTVVNPAGAYDLTFGANMVTEIHCHNCPLITSLTCNSSAVLTVVDLQNCALLKDLIFIGNNNLASIDLSTFTSLNTVNIYQNPNLVTLSIPNLVTVTGDMLLPQNNLSQMVAPVLTEVSGNLNIAALTNCTTISFPVLAAVGGYVTFAQSYSATTIEFPLLESIGVNIGAFDCLVVVQYDFSSLQSVGSQANEFYNCPALVTFSLPAFVGPLSGVLLSDNPSLTTISFGSAQFTTDIAIIAFNAALSQTTVDYILATAVAGGADSAAYIDLSGGTSSPPSAAGIVNRTILEGNGVSVFTN